MERASRLIVIVSIALAGVTHVWLVNWQPGLAAAAGVTFVTTFLLARLSLRLALALVLASTFVAPALTAEAFGSSDYHQTIVWLAAVAGPLFAHADFARWRLPLHWKAALATWAVIIAATWPIVAGRELDFSLIAARSTMPTNGLFEAAPRIAAASVVLMALVPMIGILWIDFLWMKFREASRDFSRWIVLPLVAGAVVGALAGTYQRFVDPTWMNPPIWSNMNRAGGLMLDANTFGTGAALLAPAAVALAWSLGTGWWLGAAAYGVLAAGMWSAGSRTALLVFGIGSAAVVISVLRERGLWQPRIGRIVALVGIAAFVAAAAVIPRNFESSNPLERAFARVPTLESAEIKRFATELWARFGYGTAANRMVLDHPISGVGVGAFHVVAPDYIYRDIGRRFPPDNAQNWWRHQLAELGVLGALPSIAFSVMVALLCWPRHAGATHPCATILRGILIGLGAASMLGVPTQGGAIAIVFGTVLFWLATLSNVTQSGQRGVGRLSPFAAAATVIVVAASLAMSARGDLRVPVRALQSGVPYAYGLTPPQDVSPFGGVQWMAKRAVTVIPTPHRWLRLTVWAPYPDLSTHPVAFDLHVNGRRVLSRHIATEGPVSFFVEMPSAPLSMLEMQTSRELTQDRSLQIATMLHEELPADAPDDHVFRQLR